MEKTLIICFFWAVCTVGNAQSIVGTWQLVRSTSCLGSDMTPADEGVKSVLDDMKNMSTASPVVMKFEEDHSGEESVRTVDKKKTTNSKKFLYKFDGSNLYILDKRSRTITSSYTVDTISKDSLIYSNSLRACETKVFVRIN